MVIKKEIKVEEVHDNGERKVIYEGEDKRFYNREYQRDFFGIPFSDWVKMTVFIIGGIIVGNTYIQRNDARLAALEGTTQNLTQKLTDVSSSLQSYMEASDGFHSSIFQTQFKAGRPIDGTYKNRSSLSGEKVQ